MRVHQIILVVFAFGVMFLGVGILGIHGALHLLVKAGL